MTTPQEMTPEPDEPQRGLMYRFLQKTFFTVLILILVALVFGSLFFAGLVLVKGIQWAWPF